ncbi:calcium/potassium channel (CAKC) [Strigomonas culicis]|uniref:Calcium/potassium channel (CAKC) n=1 Tax=Strigomonas culicis TaxID=28005 RepID=S9UKE5_9TRYP|nr:calcium/potassium channel (CAKC) [Strigomonas culicis]|eukprot:EPY31312.1 calcium/potassium channel (CAKC) [Strigomonas culicis]
MSKRADMCEPVDLTLTRGTPHQKLPPIRRYWRTRTVRRNKERLTESENYNQALLSSHNVPDHHTENTTEFRYISGPKYFFQRFVRQYPVAALCVWVFLFLVELSSVVLYVIQSTLSDDVSWVNYDKSEHSGWFYARSVLAIVSMLQLFFAYSLSLLTIFVVVSTSLYQIVIFFMAFSPNMGWVSRLYVPYFLRCWSLRQYFLFILDSVALMSTRERKLDLMRLSAGPLTLFICMVFTAAGIFRIDQTFRGYPLNIAVAIYFTVVTVSTVGFGDVTPRTKEGMAITIVIIFVFISKMPTFIQVIRSTAKILKAFRSYKGRKNHFIVYGLLTREEVISILDEVFCLYPMKAVCFCNKEFAPDVLAIGRHPTYRLRCTFLMVDNLDVFALRRMKASEAAGVIVFPIREGYSSRVDDDVMLTSLIFERLMPSLPQYIWLRYGLHAKLLKGQRASVIDEHMKKNIMATALLLPGIVPFLVNIVRTAWASGVEPDNLWTKDGMHDWKSQYEFSRRNVISSCVVPSRFVDLPLRDVVSKFKYYEVLVVGVEEQARKIMRLDLDYVLEDGDVLMVIYERNRNGLAPALQNFTQLGPLEEIDSQMYGNHFCHNFSENELLHGNMNASFVFYPYKAGSPSPTADGNNPVEPAHARPEDADKEAEAVSEEEVKRRLLALPFVPTGPQGVDLQSLSMGSRNAERLDTLITRHDEAVKDPYTTEEERFELVGNIQEQIVSLVMKITENEGNSASDKALSEEGAEDQEEVFLFVDQTTSILRKTNMSIYEDVISQTIAQYELYIMFQCIRSIHAKSKLSLLTLRKHSPDFLRTWQDIFGKPMRYIRGQGSLDAHLNYALTADADISKVRGILLYCSQMGPRDFGDVPIFSVENNVRELLEWNARSREEYGNLPEQNIMVELQSLTSSVKVAPFHNDPEWRRRGEQNFQETLAFMMGRCFSSNMLLPLMVHCHRDSRIDSFFEMVLNLSSTSEMFDMAMWTSRISHSQTLFKLCGNKSLQFETYGDAFEFLLKQRSCVAIGVYRLFPPSEMLSGSSRYFVTNPALSMPLTSDDIVYCLDGGAPVEAEE